MHLRHGCTLQFGGSDQWGNITAGVDYIRRRGAGPVHAFTTPLVTKADGTKFGKTEGGAVWLDPEMTSPVRVLPVLGQRRGRGRWQLPQYFSFADHDALAELEKATAERPAAREAQRALARELTTLVHGEVECAQAIAASQALFGRGSLAELSPATLARRTRRGRLGESHRFGPDVASCYANRAWCPSMNEARRTIAEGGAYVNNERVTDPEAVPDESSLLHGRFLVLRRGRRHLAGIELTPQ